MHFSQNLFAFSGGVCEYEISTIFSNQNQLSVMWKENGQWFKCIYDLLLKVLFPSQTGVDF